MTQFVASFQISRFIEADSPEAAEQWADWLYSFILGQLNWYHAHPNGVVLQGPAGTDHVKIIAQRVQPLETDHGTVDWSDPTDRFPADAEEHP